MNHISKTNYKPNPTKQKIENRGRKEIMKKLQLDENTDFSMSNPLTSMKLLAILYKRKSLKDFSH